MSQRLSQGFAWWSRLARTIGVLLLGAGNVQAQEIDSFYEAVDAFLGEHVDDGRVDYAAIQADSQGLDALVDTIASFDTTALEAADEKAFLINAYNVLVIASVCVHYPIASPLDVDGFFDQAEHRVAGETVTLDELEKQRLYGRYPDPRLHFAVVCAAVGCPELIAEAYRGETLDEQLTTQTRLALNNEQLVRVDPQAERVHLSELFDWYTGDFTAGGTSLLGFINQHRTSPIPESYRVEFMPYDWRLNDAR